MTRYEEAAMNALVELMAGEAEKKNLSLNPIHSKIYDGKYNTMVDGIEMTVSYEADCSNVFHVRKSDEHPHDAKRVYFNDKVMLVKEMN